MTRRIQELKWAKWTTAPAFTKGLPRLSAPQRAGLALQKKVGRALMHFGSDCRTGPWISYCDQTGPGLAQPDIVLVLSGGVLVLEIKLKFTLQAVPQLDALYVPLLQHLFPAQPIWRAILCKYAAPEINQFHAFSAGDAVLSDLCQDGGQPPILLWPKITPTLL